MNREVGANPNTNIAWPRRVAVGVLAAIGATGCSFAGPQEIARGEQKIVPIECGGVPVDSFEVAPAAEAVKANIDSLLCVTANESVARALEVYREDGTLVKYRDEGPDDHDETLYGFSYGTIMGNYVSVKFGMTPDQKPNLTDLRSIYVSEDDTDDQGHVTATTLTSIERDETGQWTISEYTYGPDNDILSEDGFYFNPDFKEFQSLEGLQTAYDRAFAATLNFYGV